MLLKMKTTDDEKKVQNAMTFFFLKIFYTKCKGRRRGEVCDIQK